MSRFTILASLYATLAVSGCSTRVSHEQSEPSGSSTTIVEVSRLDSPRPVPAEPRPDPQPPFIDQKGIGNIIVFGDVEQHHHFHEASEPLNVRVDMGVEVDAIDERNRRRRLVEQRLTELVDRR